MVEGNCNQRKAVPGRFFYEKLGMVSVKRFIFMHSAVQLTSWSSFSSFLSVQCLYKNKAGRQDQFVFNPGDAFRIVNYVDSGNGISQTVLISEEFQIINFRAV